MTARYLWSHSILQCFTNDGDGNDDGDGDGDGGDGDVDGDAWEAKMA